MPKIEIFKDDFDRLVKKKLEGEALEEALMVAKTELDEFDRKSGRMKLDVKDTNRPDLWSSEGIARQLRAHLGIEKGVPNYKISSSGVTLRIDKKVERVRPYMVLGIVRGVKLDEKALLNILQLQEKLALTYGSKRRIAGVGLFDLDQAKPPFTYRTFKGYEKKFVPLGMKEEMTLQEIIKSHPKGQEFAHLITGEDYPVLVDSGERVLTMPPIINADGVGKITDKTKNILVEATGHNESVLSIALNVLVTALAERGGSIETVTIIRPDGKKQTTPDLQAKSSLVDPEQARKFLGMQASNEQIMHLLSRSRYDVKAVPGKKISVKYPAYRNDIMHMRDIIEDIGIAFGYNEMEPEAPKIPTVGSTLEFEEWCDSVAEIAVGMGFQEAFTFVLTNRENLFQKMRSKEYTICEISNPVSANWTAMRNWLTPGLLEFLTKNMHVEYPQKVFEIGDAVWIDEKLETKTHNSRKLAAVISGPSVGYEHIASAADALLRNLGVKYEIHPTECAYCIPGRSGEIRSEGKFLGVIGEIHPVVLNNWKLEKAVVHFELSLEEIWKIVKG
jgi:phenylalanyl-tRNA synthetase beta chain